LRGRRGLSLQHRLKQLPHEAVGEVALELTSLSRKHQRPATLGEFARGLEQGRLANARLPLDDQRGALALARRCQRLIDPR
jgi:hypothetical protein